MQHFNIQQCQFYLFVEIRVNFETKLQSMHYTLKICERHLFDKTKDSFFFKINSVIVDTKTFFLIPCLAQTASQTCGQFCSAQLNTVCNCQKLKEENATITIGTLAYL